MAKIIINLVFVSLLTSLAHADDISIGLPEYGGSGCPGGSVAATLSPDGKALSVLFDKYIVEAGRSVGKTLDRKSCNIAIPVHVPQGYSIGIFKVDYRGYTFLPVGARAQFLAEYFFAGARGPVLGKSFNGHIDQDYLITHDLVTEQIVWTPCGTDTNLRANTSMRANSNRAQEDVLATVDSADISAGLLFHIAWRRCN